MLEKLIAQIMAGYEISKAEAKMLSLIHILTHGISYLNIVYKL